MEGANRKRSVRGRESGYALLLIMFFLALLGLSLAAAAPTVINTIQREKETEMIWRGKQYTRGIRLYYAKMKRLPGSLDDLTKPGAAGIRFMRQAYKDPMNRVDGSWRLIFLGPNGQLIGSRTNGAALGAAILGGTQTGGSSLFPTSLFSTNAGRGSLNAGAAQTATTPVTASSQNINESAADDPNQPQSLAGPLDASNTMGGNIIGVGSKVDRKSFLVFHGMQNYKLFEFILDLTSVGSSSAGVGTSAAQNLGTASPASPTGTGTPASNAGNWINQMLPGAGIGPQNPPPLPVAPQNQ
jgi:hypothetical protein